MNPVNVFETLCSQVKKSICEATHHDFWLRKFHYPYEIDSIWNMQTMMFMLKALLHPRILDHTLDAGLLNSHGERAHEE